MPFICVPKPTSPGTGQQWPRSRSTSFSPLNMIPSRNAQRPLTQPRVAVTTKFKLVWGEQSRRTCRAMDAHRRRLQSRRDVAAFRNKHTGHDHGHRDRVRPRRRPRRRPSTTISHDPNALIGPGRLRTAGLYPAGRHLSYTVDFENDGSVGRPGRDRYRAARPQPRLVHVPARFVRLRLRSMSSVPAGLTQYQTTVSYENSDGSSAERASHARLQRRNRPVDRQLRLARPTTGQAPTGVFDGFLPPNNSSGIGEGYVQYTVQPKSGLTTGTTINQQASVVFDTNAALATNTAVNTIDAGTTVKQCRCPADHASSVELHRPWSGPKIPAAPASPFTTSTSRSIDAPIRYGKARRPPCRLSTPE